MTKRRWIFALIVLSLFVAGIGARAAFIRATQGKRPAYMLTREATQYNADGTSRRVFREIRYVSSSGNWRSIQQYESGMTIDTIAVVGQGVFATRSKDGSVHFLSNYDAPTPLLTADGFRKSGYLRTENVLGHEVFVTRATNNQGVEFYSDPLLAGAQVKMVNRSDTHTVVIEPMSVVMGEPTSSQFVVPAAVPINYDTYNNLHKK